MNATSDRKRIWTVASGLVLVSLLGSVNPAAAADLTTAALAADRALTSHRVVLFALAVKGQRIGRGECTDLVVAALAHARAKKGDFSDSKNYVWGTKLRGLVFRYKQVVAPGDIIQFEGCRFEKPDGSQWFEMPHHTAIVKSASGAKVVLIHQNAPIGGSVVEQSLDFAWLKSGSYKVYRPIPQ